MSLRWVFSAAIMSLFCASTVPLTAQSGAKSGEWRSYGADVVNTHYSPLDQINASNFSKLEMAWHFKTDNLGPRPERPQTKSARNLKTESCERHSQRRSKRLSLECV